MTQTAPPPDLTIDRDVLQAMRLGEHPDPLDGVHVIGYAGVAHLLGYKAEQTVRKLAGNPASGFPAARFIVRFDGSDVRLFALADVKRWAIQTGRLDPDEVTPRRLRPRRGRARRRTHT